MLKTIVIVIFLVLVGLTLAKLSETLGGGLAVGCLLTFAIIGTALLAGWLLGERREK